jgi:hypothetical protein
LSSLRLGASLACPTVEITSSLLFCFEERVMKRRFSRRRSLFRRYLWSRTKESSGTRRRRLAALSQPGTAPIGSALVRWFRGLLARGTARRRAIPVGSEARPLGGFEPLEPRQLLTAVADVSAAELGSMQLLYATNAFTNFDNADNYTTDNSGSIATGSYDRIGYYVELGGNFAWVSMDAFNTAPAFVGVPADNSGIVHNGTVVTNMNVESDHSNVTTGTGINGLIEFWASNYGENGGGLFNSNNGLFDWKDSGGSTGGGHGSMQVANITPGA